MDEGNHSDIHTDKQVVDVAIELMNWNLQNLDYIEQEIVCVSKKVGEEEREGDRREGISESNGYNYRSITYSMIGQCGSSLRK